MSARKTCDLYFSKVVRLRGKCEWPGCPQTHGLQAAHILRRRFVGDPDGVGLRTNEDNAWCLCAIHHGIVDTDAVSFTRLVEQTIGFELYDQLLAVKNAPHRPWRESDWISERARLLAILKEAA